MRGYHYLTYPYHTRVRLPAFPSAAAKRAAAASRYRSPMAAAYHLDAVTHSTNLIGRMRVGAIAELPPPGATPDCGTKA